MNLFDDRVLNNQVVDNLDNDTVDELLAMFERAGY